MRFIIVNDEMIDTTMHPEIIVDHELGHVYEKRTLDNGYEYLHDKGMIREASNDVIKLVDMLIAIRLKAVLKEIEDLKRNLKEGRY